MVLDWGVVWGERKKRVIIFCLFIHLSCLNVIYLKFSLNVIYLKFKYTMFFHCTLTRKWMKIVNRYNMCEWKKRWGWEEGQKLNGDEIVTKWKCCGPRAKLTPFQNILIRWTCFLSFNRSFLPKVGLKIQFTLNKMNFVHKVNGYFGWNHWCPVALKVWRFGTIHVTFKSLNQITRKLKYFFNFF